MPIKIKLTKDENGNIKDIVLNPTTITIEKQVWESTLNRSMVLEAENAQLKELLKECRDEINPYIEVVGGKKTFKNLIDKINEVLE